MGKSHPSHGYGRTFHTCFFVGKKVKVAPTPATPDIQKRCDICFLISLLGVKDANENVFHEAKFRAVLEEADIEKVAGSQYQDLAVCLL